MKSNFKKTIYVFLGCLFVILGTIGIVLPVLPTTPFMLVALALFANSSPKFHQMLLNNRWFGVTLKQWEENKTVSRRIKIRASFLLLLSISISIALLLGNLILQLMLVVIGILSLALIWKLKEGSRETND